MRVGRRWGGLGRVGHGRGNGALHNDHATASGWVSVDESDHPLDVALLTGQVNSKQYGCRQHHRSQP